MTGRHEPQTQAGGQSGAETEIRRRRLHSEVQSTLEKGYGEVSADIRQLRDLLTDTVQSLNAALGDLVQRPREDPDPFAADGESLRANKAVTGRLVTALQFEDIAAQIIERARLRLTVLEMFTSEMFFGPEAHSTCPAAQSTNDEALRKLDEQIHRHRDLLRDILARRVQQDSLVTGDVELF